MVHTGSCPHHTWSGPTTTLQPISKPVPSIPASPHTSAQLRLCGQKHGKKQIARREQLSEGKLGHQCSLQERHRDAPRREYRGKAAHSPANHSQRIYWGEGPGHKAWKLLSHGVGPPPRSHQVAALPCRHHSALSACLQEAPSLPRSPTLQSPALPHSPTCSKSSSPHGKRRSMWVLGFSKTGSKLEKRRQNSDYHPAPPESSACQESQPPRIFIKLWVLVTK